MQRCGACAFFFFNDTATTEIYTLSLHDALPILLGNGDGVRRDGGTGENATQTATETQRHRDRPDQTARPLCLCVSVAEHLVRSEEHTSELQSRQYLVCRLLLEKKNTPLLPLLSP